MLSANNIWGAPAPGSRWKHVNNKQEYEVICIANLFATKPSFKPTVVYEALENRQIYARPLLGWHEKFRETI